MSANAARDQRLVNAILRTDFGAFLQRCFLTLNPGTPFLPNWHLLAMAHQLARVQRGEIQRLIFNLPPRNLKSISVSVAFAAFLLGHDPSRRIIAISYSEELALKHSSDFRLIVSSNWYRKIFPDMRIERSSEDEVLTSQRGFRRSTSVNGTLTGLGADLFIIDDPQRPADALSQARRAGLNHWFGSSLVSRLDNKQSGAIIVVMQRLHLDDLSGFLLGSGDDWELLRLPAIAEEDERIPIGEGRFYHRLAGEALHPVREPVAVLTRLRQTVGSADFLAQYQQAPVPPAGLMIKREWLRFFDQVPSFDGRPIVLQSWDTAAKAGVQNDYSVCTTWKLYDGHYYLVDLTRDRFEYPRLRDTALELAQRFGPDVILIEDASTGTALAQELRTRRDARVDLISSATDKIGRLYVQQAKFEAGKVHFPKGVSFLPELEAELLSFPQSRHDDQVDSVIQALAYEDNYPNYDSTLDWVWGTSRS